MAETERDIFLILRCIPSRSGLLVRLLIQRRFTVCRFIYTYIMTVANFRMLAPVSDLIISLRVEVVETTFNFTRTGLMSHENVAENLWLWMGHGFNYWWTSEMMWGHLRFRMRQIV